MKYIFENDLKNNLMRVKVTIPFKKLISDDQVNVKWQDIKKLVDKEYSAPKSYVLGECTNRLQNLNNKNLKRCAGTWVFVLEKKSKKSDTPRQDLRSISAVEKEKTTKPVSKARKRKTTSKKANG